MLPSAVGGLGRVEGAGVKVRMRQSFPPPQRPPTFCFV